MKRLSRLLFLSLLFTAEVRVHAESKGWMLEPEKCSQNQGGCSWYAMFSKSSWSNGANKIGANKGSLLQWISSQRVHLVRGNFLIEFSKDFVVGTPSADLTGKGLALIQRKGEVVKFTVLEGEIHIRERNGREAGILLAGHETTIRGILKSGDLDVELPQMASLQSVVEGWWALTNSNKEEFFKEFKAFVQARREKAGPLAAWQKDEVDRQVASLRASERRAYELRQRQERDKKEMRDMFRKLNYLGAELPD